jgi:predicted phosphoadenosine phosphosulfate sulfurtransferase
VSEKANDNRVHLGCGTLIIIAIIVMLFSGGKDSTKLRNQLEDVNRKIDRLEKKVDDLSLQLSRKPSSNAR